MNTKVLIGAVLALVVVVGGILLLIGLTQSESNTGSLPLRPTSVAHSVASPAEGWFADGGAVARSES